MKKFNFELNKTLRKARRGVITTAHGSFETPVFMPVGTRGTIKALSPDEVLGAGADIILGNTYHLYLRPGTEIIKRHGGLHNFMKWTKPILTDSGGYQVFSLAQGKRGQENLVKIKETGVEFQSYIDGSKHFFSPEKVIDIQFGLGSDIMMPLDWCPSAEATKKEIAEAVRLTSKWFELAWKRYQGKFKSQHLENKNTGALFAIIQGGPYADLRKKSFEELSRFSVDGFSIGGVANAGESKEKQAAALAGCLHLIPQDKPRYLMGVGELDDILNAVEEGVDMFDCVTPTRLGRHGSVWTRKGRLNLHQSKIRTELEPLDGSCDCYACRHFSRAYIAHLIREGEVLGMRLASLHNIRFMTNFIKEIREAIDNETFENFKKEYLKNLKS